MSRRMTHETGIRSATTVGAATLIIGCALLASPDRFGRALGLGGHRGAQIIGALDLALVPGLLAGTPRWPWLTARATLNAAMAAYAVTQRHRDARLAARARLFAAVLATATVVDGLAAVATRPRGGPF